MENKEQENYSKPIENIKYGKEEPNKNRSRIFNQIVNYKETFILGLQNIKDEFIKSYQNYLSNLTKKLDEYDSLIESKIESINIKNKCYSEINTLLTQMLEDKTKAYKDYINKVTELTKQLSYNFTKDDLSKGNECIERIIKEEFEKQKKLDELKLEINGEMEEKDNIKELEKVVDFGYKGIILTKMFKERFELLFSQSSDKLQRANTMKSMGGEAAPTFKINEIETNEINENIKDISITDSNLEDINFVEYFPNIECFEISNSKVSYSLAEKIKYDKINSLKLEGVGLINENFNALFEQLRKNPLMRNNLRVLSVKNNYISFLDYRKGYADNILKTMTFNNLELLDMSYNKLIVFQNTIFNSLESIKVIDLTYNDIAFPTNLTDLLKSAKSKKCLVLMTNNLAILKEKANIEYNNYLVEIFPFIDYSLKNLTLDNIFCNNNFQFISKINIGQFKNSLEYLDLSNGQLKDDNLVFLLKSKWDLPILKYFILKSNYLTEKFIYSLIDKEYNFIDKFSKLKILTLSNNKNNCSDVGKFKEFLESYKNLKILELKNTPLEYNINQFFRKKVMKTYDPKNTKQSQHAYNEDEIKIEQVFDDKQIKEKTNITIKIMDLIFTKYTKAINTHFPYLFERIDMENQFPV